MARPKKRIIQTPGLDEYLYHEMYSFTGVKEMPPALRRHFVSDKVAMKFAEYSNLEEKITMIAAMGLEFFIGFREKRVTPDALRDVVKKIKKEGASAARTEALGNNLYFFSSADYWRAITLMASTTNSASYSMDLELRKAFRPMHKWENKLKYRDLDAFKRDSVTVQFYSRLYHNINMNRKLVEHNFALNESEMDLLQYLYTNNKNYVTHDKIWNDMMYLYPKTQITKAITKLRDDLLIDRNPMVNQNEYQITGLGILKATQFLRKVLSI